MQILCSISCQLVTLSGQSALLWSSKWQGGVEDWALLRWNGSSVAKADIYRETESQASEGRAWLVVCAIGTEVINITS